MLYLCLLYDKSFLNCYVKEYIYLVVDSAQAIAFMMTTTFIVYRSHVDNAGITVN